jgi:hypothetical protein
MGFTGEETRVDTHGGGEVIFWERKISFNPLLFALKAISL